MDTIQNNVEIKLINWCQKYYTNVILLFGTIFSTGIFVIFIKLFSVLVYKIVRICSVQHTSDPEPRQIQRKYVNNVHSSLDWTLTK